MNCHLAINMESDESDELESISGFRENFCGILFKLSRFTKYYNIKNISPNLWDSCNDILRSFETITESFVESSAGDFFIPYFPESVCRLVFPTTCLKSSIFSKTKLQKFTIISNFVMLVKSCRTITPPLSHLLLSLWSLCCWTFRKLSWRCASIGDSCSHEAWPRC